MRHTFKVNEVNDELVSVAMVELGEMPSVPVKPLKPVDCFQVAFWCAVIFGVGGIVLTFAMWR